MSNVDLICEYYVVNDCGDFDGMLVFFVVDIQWMEVVGFCYVGIYIGFVVVVENVFGCIQEEWDDYIVVIDEVVDGGDVVVGIGIYFGIYKGIGCFFVVCVVYVWCVVDGEIVVFEQFIDIEFVNCVLCDLLIGFVIQFLS